MKYVKESNRKILLPCLFMPLVLFIIITLIQIVCISCNKDATHEPRISNTINLTGANSWHASSIPVMFPESPLTNDLRTGMNRALLAWNNIDPSVFYDLGSGLRPANITGDDMSDNDVRVIYQNEIFPEIQTTNNAAIILNCLNLFYFPSERGSWNYDVLPDTYSAGIDPQGHLNNPSSRWAGISLYLSKDITLQDTLVFWMMNPFSKDSSIQGKLLFDLGEISEDVLPDHKLESETSLVGDLGSSVWAHYGLAGATTQSFSNSNQDIGLDGLDDLAERAYFSSYLNLVGSNCSAETYQQVVSDPSNDQYYHFTNAIYDTKNAKVIERYKAYNKTEKNTFTSNNEGIATRQGDSEDINQDGLLSTSNNYYEYFIDINPQQFQPGRNFITEIRHENNLSIHLENGKRLDSWWDCFRIPLSQFSSTVGSPGSQPARCLRIFLTGFDKPVVLRFAILEMHLHEYYTY